MNRDLSDFLIQSAATVIGGMILFLLGLLYSAISKRSKEYTNWRSKNWRLLIGICHPSRHRGKSRTLTTE